MEIAKFKLNKMRLEGEIRETANIPKAGT